MIYIDNYINLTKDFSYSYNKKTTTYWKAYHHPNPHVQNGMRNFATLHLQALFVQQGLFVRSHLQVEYFLTTFLGKGRSFVACMFIVHFSLSRVQIHRLSSLQTLFCTTSSPKFTVRSVPPKNLNRNTTRMDLSPF